MPPIPASAVDVAVWPAAAVGAAGAVIAMTIVGVDALWVDGLLPVGGVKGNATPQPAIIKGMHMIAKIRKSERRFLILIPSSNILEPFSSCVTRL
jgi:hypothetical protein